MSIGVVESQLKDQGQRGNDRASCRPSHLPGDLHRHDYLLDALTVDITQYLVVRFGLATWLSISVKDVVMIFILLENQYAVGDVAP